MGGQKSSGSRRLALLLLLANVLVAGAFLGWQSWSERSVRLPEFNADKVRLLDQPRVGKTEVARQRQPSKLPILCYRAGSADPARLNALLMQLEQLGLGGERLVLLTDVALPWWVYWPPEYEPARRQAVQQQFAQAGVKDLLPITRGPMAQSYSLGMFPTGGQARAHRDLLRQKGLEKAEYGPRSTLGTFRLKLELTSEDSAQSVKTVLPDWLESLPEAACGNGSGGGAG